MPKLTFLVVENIFFLPHQKNMTPNNNLINEKSKTKHSTHQQAQGVKIHRLNFIKIVKIKQIKKN
jgi:hypothetical protein